MKILLVEDHPAVAEISCMQLREIYDHDVELVTNGREALAKMESYFPDLVLLDLNLPDMSGYDVARILRDDGRWDSVVLVALTGFGNEVDPGLATRAGIDATFRKPMKFETLPEIRRRAH